MNPKTEFYEVAVRSGFYGIDASGLVGKKDNVRKFWEDMSIKLWLRPILESLLSSKPAIRVVDLGCGSGEGLELLTHVPAQPHRPALDRDFLLSAKNIAEYVGLDISPAMVGQGSQNYRESPNVRFVQADLSDGFPLSSEAPFDLYFSTYGSLSHLDRDQLAHLTEQVCSHVTDQAYMVFDLLGRFSPEWPAYWTESIEKTLPYNMAYLLKPEERTPDRIEWFPCSFWSASELLDLLHTVEQRTQRRLEVCVLADRSIFVGRHMDTGIFNGRPQQFRHQVNRLLDHGYRGQPGELKVDLSHLADRRAAFPAVWNRLEEYANCWNSIIELLESLMTKRDDVVKQMIESAEPRLADDMKMLAWICRNSERFPVEDFWASVVGPQTTVVLRNLEMTLPKALGCGHALFCVVCVAPTG